MALPSSTGSSSSTDWMDFSGGPAGGGGYRGNTGGEAGEHRHPGGGRRQAGGEGRRNGAPRLLQPAGDHVLAVGVPAVEPAGQLLEGGRDDEDEQGAGAPGPDLGRALAGVRPIKRMVQEARERGVLIDATYGRRTNAVLVMDNDYLVLSALPPEAVAGRGEGEDSGEEE